MAVATRSIRTSPFTTKGIILTILGIFLIIALFFIPEIIEYQRSLSGTAKVVGTMKTLKTSAASIPTDPKDSQLSRIASLVESGYLDNISKDADKNVTKTEEESGQQVSDKKVVKSDEKTSPASENITNAPSWKALKSKNSRAAFKKAHKEIKAILNVLPADRKGSRFALLNLANGMEQTIDGDLEKSTAATAAIKKLELLHSACISEFIREGVNQVSYRRFVSIDFGPAINPWSAKLSGQLIPFNPQLTLTHLTISQRKSRKVSGPILVSFKGYVVGDDVDRIEIVTGGVRLEDLDIKTSDKEGFRRFKSNRIELTGKVLLKVHDKRGRIYQKLYSFYPRAKIFENTKGRFLIPKTASDFDSRLDRFFTYQISRPNSDSDSFLKSQGFEKF